MIEKGKCSLEISSQTSKHNLEIKHTNHLMAISVYKGLFGSSSAPSFHKSESGASPNGPAPRSWLPGSERYAHTKTGSNSLGDLRNREARVDVIYEQLPPRSESRGSRTGSLPLFPVCSCV